jgi:hypothetical protein
VLVLTLAGWPAAAQVRATVRFGVGTVRTEHLGASSGSSFTSAMVSPNLRFSSPNLVVQASGYFASLPNGANGEHGRLQTWGVTPRIVGRWRLGAEGILTGTTRSGGFWTMAAHGMGELLWSTRAWGFAVGAGPSTGRIANDVAPHFVALHTRGRAWWRPGGGTEWQFSVEPTQFFSEWFTDVGAGVQLERGPVALSLSADARLSQVYGSTGAGAVLVQLFPASSVSLELGGGSYLREPYQGFPRGAFMSFGVRLGAKNPARPSPTKGPGPLVPQMRGDSIVVRFRFADVRAVAIAGDWDGWQVHPLRSHGGGLWEGAFLVARGVHHFNLLVNGQTWVVPAGVVTIPDGLGGSVAVLFVK